MSTYADTPPPPSPGSQLEVQTRSLGMPGGQKVEDGSTVMTPNEQLSCTQASLLEVSVRSQKLKKRVAELQAHLEEMQAKENYALREMNAAKQEMNAAKQGTTRLREEMDIMQANFIAKYEEREAECARLTKALTEREAENVRLTDQIAETKSESSARIQQHEAELGKMKEENIRLASEVDEMKPLLKTHSAAVFDEKQIQYTAGLEKLGEAAAKKLRDQAAKTRDQAAETDMKADEVEQFMKEGMQKLLADVNE